MHLPDKRYNIIYADPPWSYYKYNAPNRNKNLNAAANFKTMSDEEVYKLPVKDIADKNCALFLWTTWPKLQEGLRTISEWGFEYKTAAFVWTKSTRPTSPMSYFPRYFGLGSYTRSGSEVCLLGIKGSMRRKNRFIGQVQQGIVRAHSAKPAIFRDLIVRLFGDLPRIELFARERIQGWDAWGNQITEDSINPKIPDFYR